jgi:probable phosphoglycerate mutase
LEEKIYPLLKEGKDILIVGHGAMNCSIVSQIRGYDLAHFWDGMTDNCKLVRLA